MLTIFKGDDTGGVIGKRITLRIETEIPVENCKLVFSFCSTRREFTNVVSGQDIEIFFSHNETQMFPLGTSRANLTLVDASGKVRTLSNSLQIRVTNNVAECYGSDAQSATVTIRAMVRWEDVANKPTEFPPEAHTHTTSQISNFAQSLSAWWDSFKASVRIGWNQIIELPQGKSLSSVANVEKSADGKKLTVTPVSGESFEFQGGEEQVQANWTQTDNTKPDFIQNKPKIPDEQVNADWNATSGKAQILNKPNLSLKRDMDDANVYRFAPVITPSQSLGDDIVVVFNTDPFVGTVNTYFPLYMGVQFGNGKGDKSSTHLEWSANEWGGGFDFSVDIRPEFQLVDSDYLVYHSKIKTKNLIPAFQNIYVNNLPFETGDVIIDSNFDGLTLLIGNSESIFLYNGNVYSQSVQLASSGLFRISRTSESTFVVELIMEF